MPHQLHLFFMQLLHIIHLTLHPHILITQHTIILTHPIELFLQLNNKPVLFRYGAKGLLELPMMRMKLLRHLVLVVVLFCLGVRYLVLRLSLKITNNR